MTSACAMRRAGLAVVLGVAAVVVTIGAQAPPSPAGQVGYVAIGAANGRPPEIGHYCVLAGTYGAQAFSAALKAAGLAAEPTAAGAIGMWRDPDGLEP